MRTNPTPPGGDLRTQRIVWIGMLGSVLVYGVILALVSPPRDPEADTLALALAAMAVPVGAFSVVVHRLLRLAPPTGPIVRWAMAESVAIFGLVAAFLGGPPLIAGLLFAFALVLLAIAYPAGG